MRPSVVLSGLAAASIALCVPSLAAEPSSKPAIKNASAPTIAQFLKIRTPGGLRITADGTVLITDWPDGVTQLYKRAPGAPITDGGEKISQFKDGISGFTVAPDGKTVLAMAAVGGNEQTQVYTVDVAAKKVEPLLQNPEVVYSVNKWLVDSSGFLYTANDKSPRDFYIYRYDFATKASKPILEKPGQWGAVDITKDGARALVVNFRSASDSRSYELNTATGELTDLSATPESEPTSNTVAGYLPDEKSVLMISDYQGGMARLYSRVLGESKLTEVFPKFGKMDVDDVEINEERTLLGVAYNEDGYGTMHLFRLPGMEPVELPKIDRGLVSISDISGDRVLYTQSNTQSPSITYEFVVPPAGAKILPKARQLTSRMDSEPIDLKSFRLPELVKYKSFDGLEIPAFVYLPEGAKKGNPIPFVVNFHGGPEGQSRPGFTAAIQYLVSRGYGVMQPNVRGSTGYGREFHMLDNYKKRWDSVKDGVEAARWLVKEGWAQNKRIAAYGGSYGGFMAVATVIEGADVFGASIDVVGIVNMKTFLEQTKGYRQKLREAEYGPLSDPDFLATISSIHRLDEIKVPMMIAHGLNDPRVPIGEALQLAVGLQKRGYDPELLIFPDEGHGFAKLENRTLFSERMVKFLDETIGANVKP